MDKIIEDSLTIKIEDCYNTFKAKCFCGNVNLFKFNGIRQETEVIVECPACGRQHSLGMETKVVLTNKPKNFYPSESGE